MPFYFDTSAIIPLLVREPATPRCLALWADADTIVSSALTLVEAHSALALAHRTGRLTASEHEAARAVLDARWADVTTITPSDETLRVAADLTASHALRAYDAIQFASALALASDDLIAVSGDRALLAAWSDLGVITAATI